MNVLALDPATQLGWAASLHGKIAYGSDGFHNNKWDGAGMRFHKFAKWLEQWDDIDLIIYEAVRAHTGTTAAHMYGGWLALIQSYGERNDIPYTGVDVPTIKRFWTGSGTATKAKMINEARKRGFNPKDDNDADALAILHYGLENYGLQDGLKRQLTFKG